MSTKQKTKKLCVRLVCECVRVSFFGEIIRICTTTPYCVTTNDYLLQYICQRNGKAVPFFDSCIKTSFNSCCHVLSINEIHKIKKGAVLI